MIIRNLQKSSLIDYPGKLSCIVFTQGCNFRCPFCHNPELVHSFSSIPTDEKIDEKEFFSFLQQRKGKLDAVTITGGEPTLHNDLPEFCKKIKALGFLVKLDTNGTSPETLKKLIDKKLVDYIAMDIKTALEPGRYEKATGIKISEKDIEKLKRSIDIIKELKNHSHGYEFRVTCVPTLVTKNDLLEIAKYLEANKANAVFYLQQFQKEKLLSKKFKGLQPYTKAEFFEFKSLLEPYFKHIEIRGI